MKNKVLVMISNEIQYKDLIKNNLKTKYYEAIDFIVAPSNNLVECTDYYISWYQSKNYQHGLIIWITGVAVTNLLAKSLQDCNAITVESKFYLENILDDTNIDILVLGEMLIGYKNLIYIYDCFFNHLLKE